MRAVVNLCVVVLFTGIASILAIIVGPFSPRGIHRIGRGWARSLLWACGVEVQLTGRERLAPGAAYLVMANHTSHVDVVALYATLPIPVRFVAKRELQFVPVFGWALLAGAAILIDRGDRTKAMASIARARATIAAGQSVFFFPEGTRTPPGELGPLKKGPFYLAVEAGIPVLPIGIAGTGQVLPRGAWRLHRGRVAIRIGAPIEPRPGAPEDAERERLAEKAAGALRALMDEAERAIEA